MLEDGETVWLLVSDVVTDNDCVGLAVKDCVGLVVIDSVALVVRVTDSVGLALKDCVGLVVIDSVALVVRVTDSVGLTDGVGLVVTDFVTLLVDDTGIGMLPGAWQASESAGTGKLSRSPRQVASTSPSRR